MCSYPNQKIIHINKKKYSGNFLQIGIDEWKAAYQELKPSTFALYLYLASNADGYDLALSQVAVQEALGIKKTAYHTAVAELRDKGYITPMQGNIEAFNTAPVRKCGLRENELKNDSAKTNLEVRENELPSSQKRTTDSAKTNLEVRKNDREIDNRYINNINKIDSSERKITEKRRDELKLIVLSDGYITKKEKWIDEIKDGFYDLPQDKQVETMAAAADVTKEEADYILKEIVC